MSAGSERTSGEPVTNFKHSTRLYNVALPYHRRLDRDKDGIAWRARVTGPSPAPPGRSSLRESQGDSHPAPRYVECAPGCSSRHTASFRTRGILGAVQGRHADNPAGPERGEIVLRTARLILRPLTRLDEADHARASKDAAEALRDTRAADMQWREHGFGPWSIRDRQNDRFLGGAELRFAGAGIAGIDPDEVEAGWWVTEERRNEGIATEAMQAAIADLWARTDVESITAYVEEGENEPSRRLAAKLGFTARGAGRGRSGEPMTVYELRRDDWHRPTHRGMSQAFAHVTRAILRSMAPVRQRSL